MTIPDETRPQAMRPFFIILTGQSISLLGSQLVQFALVWWIARTTNSATLLAMATLTALLPQILIGPFAGALVDRWSRRWIMVAADSGTALATLVLALLFLFNLAAVWTVYVLLLVRAIGAAFQWPAMQASTTLMVPRSQLARVAGINQTIAGIAGIFIPPLGALAMEALPMQAVLAIDVITAIPAIVSLLFIAVPQPGRSQTQTASGRKPSVWSDMREGLNYILNWKALMMFSTIGLVINFFGRAASSFIPLLVTQHFKGGVTELGWLQSAVGIGAVVGGVILGVWGGFKRRVFTLLLALSMDGFAILAIGLSPQQGFSFAVGLIFLVGFLETIIFGLNGATFQAIIPPEVQGRVFSLLMSGAQIMAPLGLLVAGPVSDAFGVNFWWALTGIIIAGMGIAALCIPPVVHIEEDYYKGREPAKPLPSAAP